MSQELTMATRRDLTKKYAKTYQAAMKGEKGRILTELCATTGWSRVNARRAIRLAAGRVGPAPATRKPRGRKYSYDALTVLIEVWSLAGEPCGKYLAPVMDDTLERLIRFGELKRVKTRLTLPVIAEVKAMSPATIDRYLAPTRATRYPSGSLSTTSPSRLLRASIPIRTAMDGFPKEPGYLELDTVAHCGPTTKGEYLITINATDPYLGWGIQVTVKNKAYIHMKTGMDFIIANYPLALKGVDFDNGSEFINWGIIAWLDEHHIPTITRARAYQHNDNAHVEQRNNDWVRHYSFRYRYETDEEMNILNQLWAAVSDRKNYLLPCVKAQRWESLPSGRKRCIYDKPRTPWQRLLDTTTPNDPALTRLAARHDRLNPAATTRRINECQHQLIRSVEEHPNRPR